MGKWRIANGPHPLPLFAIRHSRVESPRRDGAGAAGRQRRRGGGRSGGGGSRCGGVAGDLGIELEQRLRRVDQAPAELIVATIGAKRPRARGEDFLHRGDIDRRIPLDQQRGDAANMGGGNRRAGRELVAGIGRRLENVDPRRRQRDLRPAIGLREQLVIGVGGSDRDHVGIGGRIERRRARPGIAGGRDQHHAFVARVLHRQLQHRIIGAGEAHIDDAGAAFDGPFEARENVLGGGLRRFCGVRAEGMDGEYLGAGRNAHEPTVRSDRAGHAGAVGMRLVGAPDRIELIGDRAGEIGMLVVDRGIDDGDEHVVAGGDLVDVAEVKLVDHVLAGLGALGAGGQGCVVLLQREHVVRLGSAQVLGFERAHGGGDVAAVGDAEAEQRAAGQRGRLGLDGAQAEPARDGIDILPGDVGADVEHHLPRHEARLAHRWHACEATLAGQRTERQPAALRQQVRAMRDLHAPRLDRGALAGEATCQTTSVERSPARECVAPEGAAPGPRSGRPIEARPESIVASPEGRRPAPRRRRAGTRGRPPGIERGRALGIADPRGCTVGRPRFREPRPCGRRLRHSRVGRRERPWAAEFRCAATRRCGALRGLALMQIEREGAVGKIEADGSDGQAQQDRDPGRATSLPRCSGLARCGRMHARLPDLPRKAELRRLCGCAGTRYPRAFRRTTMPPCRSLLRPRRPSHPTTPNSWNGRARSPKQRANARSRPRRTAALLPTWSRACARPICSASCSRRPMAATNAASTFFPRSSPPSRAAADRPAGSMVSSHRISG